MKKRLCMFLAMLLILMMVTPAFAASAAPNEDEYTFAVEQENGLTICMAVVVENGIPRQLTKAEYNCTVTYANMVGGNWDGIYECAESYTGVSSDFPPPA